MSASAIEVRDLSKIYRIGVKESRRETLVGAMVDAIASPVRNYKRLRDLTTFKREDYQGDDVVWALRDVSLDVSRGEVLGIIGANGAGKSTLLKILAGITEPTSGRAVIRGRMGSLLEVGTGMHPELTGRENIFLTGTLLGMKKADIDRKFDEIVEFAEVARFIDTPVKRYSSGMKVRLGFAIAAHLEPEILLVDEVLAVGDATFQNKCIGKMGSVAGEGRTVLFVSHNLSSIISLCPESILVQEGRIAGLGASHDIVRQYLSWSEGKETGSLQISKDSGGSQGVELDEWAMVDPDYGLGRRVGSGNPVCFKLSYHINQGKEIRWISLCLVIKDNLGRPIFSGATSFSGESLRDPPSRGFFECHFPHFPLAPGLYRLHIWYEDDNGQTLRLPNAGVFEVVSGKHPLFTHWPNPDRHGPVALAHTWRVSNASIASGSGLPDGEGGEARTQE